MTDDYQFDQTIASDGAACQAEHHFFTNGYHPQIINFPIVDRAISLGPVAIYCNMDVGEIYPHLGKHS